MARLRTRGERLHDSRSRLILPGGRAAEVRSAVLVGPVARHDADVVEVEAAADDLVEVELEGGLVFWTTVGRLREDAAALGVRHAGDLDLPTRFPLAEQEKRGVVGAAIESLKLLGYDLPAGGARWVAEEVVEKRIGEPGLHRIAEDGSLEPARLPAGGEPSLVLVHGTASSTSGGFGDLISSAAPPERDEEAGEAKAREARAERWKTLRRHYGERVYGFEHRTLTESPVENALAFLRALPAGASPRLHLVSHSRGGLVGELLAHGGLDRDAFPEELLAAAGVEAPERELFQELDDLLARKRPRLERFVRVACPAGGTTLASGRLDIYLSLLFGLLGQLLPPAAPLLGAVGELLAAVAKERTRPEVLPGLAAQMPRSTLIRVLNGSTRELDSDLTVIAGDSDGLLKNLANLFYWRANDLVVDTRSMYRGATRRRRLWYRSEGREVHHCNYFARTETLDRLVGGLIRGDDEAAGFASGRPRAAVRGSVPAGDPGEAPERPAVVLLPGIMGSHLSVRDGGERNRVWVDLSDLMKGRFEQLAFRPSDDPDRVRADGLVERAYADLVDFLRQAGQHVIPFPYDWRGSVADAAGALRDVLRTRLEASAEPVRLVAHSMGGLVARYLVARRGEWSEWDEIVRRGGRLVQLGTPNRGSYVIPQLLRGEDKLLRRLALLDLDHPRRRWVEWLARFPGILEMAPQGEDRDFSLVRTWKELDVLAAPTSADLTEVRRVVSTLAGVDLADHPVVYVAGRADETPTMEPGADRLGSTRRGDGRVTWESGIPPGVDCWWVDAEHGSLADCPPAFEGLLELIVEGDTRRLAREESALPPRKRSRSSLLLAGDDSELFPTQESLETAALGMEEEEPWSGPPADEPRCTVRVVQKDLTYAAHPVMVGHYAGDPIVHAEAALDRFVGGELSRRHQLDLYPREVGSHELVVVEREPGAPRRGALVVGLGISGDLSPGALSRSVEAAVVRYVQKVEDSSPSRDESPLGLSSLLVGSGEAGLSLEQVVESILYGLLQANRRLRETRTAGDAPRRGVGELELIELYEDRALETLHILARMAERSPGGFDFRLQLERGKGGRRRFFHREPEGWWRPVRIESGPPGVLTFSIGGRQARVADEPLQVQTALVDRLLAGSRRSASEAQRRLRETLFELLTPALLRDSARDRNHLLLDLDAASARYPWELLVDRRSESGSLGLGAGLVRQLRRSALRPVAYVETRTALVVGDPPSGLPELPGARGEARRVAGLLESKGRWRVERQIRNDPRSAKAGRSEIGPETIVCAALPRDHRILHLAGHGVYDAERPDRSGMVIGGDPRSDEGLVLFSPIEVERMRLTPELVFINCCHLGRIEATPPHLLAANLATEFIDRGVRAVVAAGWEVDDEAAGTFATTFYGEMLAGATFGDAVLRARRTTHEGDSRSHTWAAYQCYGDPGFRLTMGSPHHSEAATPYLDVQEVVAELGNLVSRAGTEQGERRDEGIRAEIEELEELIRSRGWDADADALAGLARAYGEVDAFAEAVSLYERALRCDAGSATLKDLEQCANLRARHADEMARAGELPRKEAVRRIRRSIRELEWLVGSSPNNERWSLLGSACKRLATTLGEKAEPRHLAEMVAAYAEAAVADPDDLYPALNALAGILALGGPWREPPDEMAAEPFAEEEAFDRRLAGARELALRQSAEAAHFWDRTYLPDAELLAALRAAGTDGAAQAAERFAEVERLYLRLLEPPPSAREKASVLGQIDFLGSAFRRLAAAAPAREAAGFEERARRLASLVERLRAGA